MNILLDTHVLLWVASDSRKLQYGTRRLLEDPANAVFFSVASLWEITIKNASQRSDFQLDPCLLRRSLLENDYTELPISGAHAVAADLLTAIHKDPFDRILIAQAQHEALTLLTADKQIARYPGPIRLLESPRRRQVRPNRHDLLRNHSAIWLPLLSMPSRPHGPHHRKDGVKLKVVGAGRTQAQVITKVDRAESEPGH